VEPSRRWQKVEFMVLKSLIASSAIIEIQAKQIERTTFGNIPCANLVIR